MRDTKQFRKSIWNFEIKAEKCIKLKSRHTKYYILRIFNLIGHKKICTNTFKIDNLFI